MAEAQHRSASSRAQALAAHAPQWRGTRPKRKHHAVAGCAGPGHVSSRSSWYERRSARRCGERRFQGRHKNLIFRTFPPDELYRVSIDSGNATKMLSNSGRLLKGERPADLGPAGDKSRASDRSTSRLRPRRAADAARHCRQGDRINHCKPCTSFAAVHESPAIKQESPAIKNDLAGKGAEELRRHPSGCRVRDNV